MGNSSEYITANEALIDFEESTDVLDVRCCGLMAWSLLRQRLNIEILRPHWESSPRNKGEEASPMLGPPARKWRCLVLLRAALTLLFSKTIFAVFSKEYRVDDGKGVSNINSYVFQRSARFSVTVQCDDLDLDLDDKKVLYPPQIKLSDIEGLIGFVKLFRQQTPLSIRERSEIQSASEALALEMARFPSLPSSEFTQKNIESILTDTINKAREISEFFIFFGVKDLYVNQSYGYEYLLAAAKFSGVRISEAQHGLAPRNHAGYGWSGRAADCISLMTVPDRLFLYGSYWRSEMLANGFWPESRLYVTGSYSMDLAREARRAYLSKRTRVNTPTVLITTQPFYEDRCLRWVEEFVAGINERGIKIRFVIKVHPFHGESLVAEAFRELDYVDVFDHSRPIESARLIAVSDLHMSSGSTCLFESLALGVPTVLIPTGISAHVRAELLRLGARSSQRGHEISGMLEDIASWEAGSSGSELYASDSLTLAGRALGIQRSNGRGCKV